MFDSWRIGSRRDRGSSGQHRVVPACVERLETRVLMYYATSVWTGYWNTNQGVLIVGALLPPHGSPYPQLDDELLDGSLANANTNQSISPPNPDYYFNANIDIDPTYAAVLTGTVTTLASGLTPVGQFKLSMNMNPDYPNTPDSFTGTFNAGAASMTITGTYAGDQTAYPYSYIAPGSDANPPRPRPIFSPTSTPTPTPQQPKKPVVNLALHLVHPSAMAIKKGKTALKITIINRGPDKLPVDGAEVWVTIGPPPAITVASSASWGADVSVSRVPITDGDRNFITALLPAMTRGSEVRLYVREENVPAGQLENPDITIQFVPHGVAEVELDGEKVTTSISGSSRN
jgi:hypothetical protein